MYWTCHFRLYGTSRAMQCLYSHNVALVRVKLRSIMLGDEQEPGVFN